jgi:orotidine-5'-phosphate decarboxylase
MPSFADRLAAAVRHKGPLCVGLDPRWDMLPRAYRAEARPGGEPSLRRAAEQTLAFCERVLDLVAPHAAVVKPQAAFFELLGPAGFVALGKLIEAARTRGFVVILDAKRGDIASTAAAYADAAFGGCRIGVDRLPVWNADALTINPYLGRDAVEPFLTEAKAADRGVFVLVRTSNPGSGLFQDLVCDGRPVYRHVAAAVAEWNRPTIGGCGLGDVGAVVGATHPRELADLRAALPDVWFLVPGYGTQGGTAADVKAAYRSDGLGAVVNSARGVVFPFEPEDPAWEAKVAAAAERAANELKP